MMLIVMMSMVMNSLAPSLIVRSVARELTMLSSTVSRLKRQLTYKKSHRTNRSQAGKSNNRAIRQNDKETRLFHGNSIRWNDFFHLVGKS